MKGIGKLVRFGLALPVYWCSRLVPKRRDLWVFGAWYGRRYADNARALFEYVRRHDPTIRPVWLSADEDIVRSVRADGGEAHRTFTPTGAWLSARAAIGVVTNSKEDLNPFAPPARYINLWHGIALKKIVADDEKARPVGRLRAAFQRLAPYAAHELRTELMVSSGEEAARMTSAFRIPPRLVHVTGQPRNDVLQRDRPMRREGARIMYMPTHRGFAEADVSQLFTEAMPDVQRELAAQGGTLQIKMHYVNAEATRPVDYPNIRFLRDEDVGGDVYGVLDDVDILITDYSSVYFDFLLTGRPIVFAPFDLEDYLARERGMYFDYEAVTPGPHCRSWPEVMAAVRAFLSDPTLYEEERRVTRDRFHAHLDREASRRVHETIVALQGRG